MQQVFRATPLTYYQEAIILRPSLDNLRDILMQSDAVGAAFEVSKDLGQKAYLVGGAVRDLLMDSRLGNDLDFVVEGKGVIFARAFAERVKGSFFILDEDRDSSRVVFKMEVRSQESEVIKFQADFSGMRGDIEEDLRLRDFTINSLAIPLDSIFEPEVSGQEPEAGWILNPVGGLKDIKGKVLRESSACAIEDDPLRIMRAFRFSSSFNLEMDEALSAHVKMQGKMLGQVSAERVRAELFMILDMPGAYNLLGKMDELGVLTVIFPELAEWKGFYQGGWHAHDLFNHSMKAVEAAEEVLRHLSSYFPGYYEKIEEHINEEVEAGVTRRGLLKLASLLHDSGKLHTRVMEGGRGRFLGHEKAGDEISLAVARRLKLSRRSEMTLRGLTANHMRILGLSKLKNVTSRARYRFFRDTGGFGIDLLLLSMADSMATPIEREKWEGMKKLIGRLADYYFEEFTLVPPRPLLTGEDVMRAFAIQEGKEVGEMLEALREAETLGKVSNRREAVEYLHRRYKT